MKASHDEDADAAAAATAAATAAKATPGAARDGAAHTASAGKAKGGLSSTTLSQKLVSKTLKRSQKGRTRVARDFFGRIVEKGSTKKKAKRKASEAGIAGKPGSDGTKLAQRGDGANGEEVAEEDDEEEADAKPRDPLLYKFQEGFSNAVRRIVKIDYLY